LQSEPLIEHVHLAADLGIRLPVVRRHVGKKDVGNTVHLCRLIPGTRRMCMLLPTDWLIAASAKADEECTVTNDTRELVA
jgi:hypothetical protein